ncbi:hypothetical protein ACN9MF_20340 [Methylobacterium fujisawaense]|uniref:hypothetical protein n=1 Tax=Methylobacterium fujisawaense TaxID=107400 RepID=UPI003CE96401
MSRPDKRQRERVRKQRKAERRAQAAAEMIPAPSSISTAAQPVRGTLAPVIDRTLCWHMVRTKPLLGPLGRKHLDEALKNGEVCAYRPRASEVVVRRGRRVVRHVPLLIRTLIIGVRDRDHLDTVARLPGVAEIVSHPVAEGNAEGNVAGIVMRPARLDPVALQAFLAALAAGEIVCPVGIAVGEQVVVMTGPFASFPAVVEAILPADRIKVALSIFGRSSPVELGIANVQRL